MVNRRMTKGEMKKREDLENLSLLEIALNEKVNDEQSKRDRIASDHSIKEGLSRKLAKNIQRLKASQSRELGLKEGEGVNDDLVVEKLDTLNASKEQLQISLQGYDVILKENEFLTRRVNKLKVEYEEQNQINLKGLKTLKRDMFTIRMKVELTFRKTTKSLETEYEDRAVNAMQTESSKAISENQRLNEILIGQRDEVIKMMDMQKGNETNLRKEKINRDILESHIHLQGNGVEVLEQNAKEQTLVVTKVQSAINVLHNRLKYLKEQEKDMIFACKEMETQRVNTMEEAKTATKWKQVARRMAIGIDAWLKDGGNPRKVVGGFKGFEYDEESEDLRKREEEEKYKISSFYEVENSNVGKAVAADSPGSVSKGGMSAAKSFVGSEGGGGDDEDLDFIWRASKSTKRKKNQSPKKGGGEEGELGFASEIDSLNGGGCSIISSVLDGGPEDGVALPELLSLVKEEEFKSKKVKSKGRRPRSRPKSGPNDIF